MPRDGVGIYSLPSGGNITLGNLARSPQIMLDLNDIAAALNSGGFVGLPGPNSVSYAVDTGVVNALIASTAATSFAYTAGAAVDVLVGNTNTSTVVTINILGLGVKSVTDIGGNGPTVGTLVAGLVYRFVYDGTTFRAQQVNNRVKYGDIRDYGAVTGVDCSAIVTTAAALIKNIIFPSGAWVITTLPTIPAGVLVTAQAGATFSGTGASLLGLPTGAVIVGNQISDYNPPVTGELATLNIVRLPKYTGGPSPGVNAGLRVQTNVGANVVNFEWAIIGIVNNAATGGQNVGVYGQGNKGSTGVTAGPTWGMVAQAIDKTGLSDPTTGCVGLEVNIDCDGTDNTGTGRRLGIDVVSHNYSGVAQVARYGVRVHTDGFAGSSFTHGLYLDQVVTNGITIATAAGSVLGINLSGSTFSGPAIRLEQNQYISFKSDDSIRLSYDSVRLALTVGGTLTAGIDSASGILNLGTGGAFGSSDAIISQVNFPNAATSNFSHRAQDIVRGTIRSGAVFANNTILTNITVANYRAFEVGSPALQAGALVTNCVGLYVNDLTTGGTLNAGVQLQVASGAGKWNVYAPGTAINHFKGNVLIGTTTDSGAALTVTASAGSGLTVTGFAGNPISVFNHATAANDYVELQRSTTGFARLGNGSALTGASADDAALWGLAGSGLSLGANATTALRIASTGSITIIAPAANAAGLTVTGSAATPTAAVAFSATAMTVDCSRSNVFATTFTATVTAPPTFNNPQDGQTINWYITQDGVGGRLITGQWPASFKWPGGAPGVLSTGANAVDILVGSYRSSTGFWSVTLNKAYA